MNRYKIEPRLTWRKMKTEKFNPEAAGDILEALRLLTAYVEKYNLATWAPEGDTIVDLARAAIAKAEGK